jgi:hypothetical protein
MILTIGTFITILAIFLFKYEKRSYMYIPYLMGFLAFTVMVFIPELGESFPKIIQNTSQIYILASVYSLIITLLVYRLSGKDNYYLLYSFGLFGIGFTNKYILSLSIVAFLLSELLNRDSRSKVAINSKLFYLIPTIISVVVFSNEFEDYKNIIYFSLLTLLIFIDIYKLSRSRSIAYFLFIALISYLNCDQQLIIVFLSASSLFISYEVYKSFIEKGIDLYRFKTADRIYTYFVTQRNVYEKEYSGYIEKTKPINKKKIRNFVKVSFENDLRNKFLMMVGLYCLLAIYFFVRA